MPTFAIEELAVVVGPEVDVLYDVAFDLLPVDGLALRHHVLLCVFGVGL